MILYSVENEIGEIGRRSGGRRNRQTANLFHALDDTRFITGAISGFLAMSDRVPEMVDTMDRAEKEQKESMGSEALNAAMSKIAQAKLDAFSCSEGLSETMEEVVCEWDVAGYNYLTARHEFDTCQCGAACGYSFCFPCTQRPHALRYNREHDPDCPFWAVYRALVRWKW